MVRLVSVAALVLVHATASPPPPPVRYLSSWSYTISSTAAAYKSSMWTADDFIVKDADGKERPWQNLILVTGNATYFAELSAEILRRTGHNLPMLWAWSGWRNELPRGSRNCSETPVGECWTGCPMPKGPPWPCAGGQARGSCNACACNEHNTSCSGEGRQPYEQGVSLDNFTRQYEMLKTEFPHLPATPWGVYVGDEPDLARNPERISMLAKGLAMVKQRYPQAITYLNMLYGSIGCPGPNPGGPFLCNASTWDGDPTALAIALGKMVRPTGALLVVCDVCAASLFWSCRRMSDRLRGLQYAESVVFECSLLAWCLQELDWMSTDEYYDVAMAHYQMVYRERLYPHLRPEQRIVLLPFAAYCEIGCEHNTTIAGPQPQQQQNCSETPWGEGWTGCPMPKGPPWPCAGGVGPRPPGGSCNACVCNERNTSCNGQGRQPYDADPRCLGSAKAHLAWAENDSKVIGLYVHLLPLLLLLLLFLCVYFPL